MQFIETTEPGNADVLKLGETRRPHCADDQVLIKVAAAGVNRPDIMQRKGLYNPPADASPILGLEVAGYVERVGDQVTLWAVGDAVCALVNGGGYAEYVTVPATQCLPVPAGWSLIEAASLPETYFTVWSNVYDRAKLQVGESLLVHGGSSGIGVAAIQMAVATGSTVYTTAGTAKKCQTCIELGATLAVNYKTEDFTKSILAHTNKQGVDVILDMVAGDYLEKNMALSAQNGRIAMIAFMGGHKTNVSLLPMLMKNLNLSASTLRPQSQAQKAAIAESLLKTIWPHLDNGQIQPVIAAQIPLAEAAEAHKLMESSEHIGKIILTI